MIIYAIATLYVALFGLLQVQLLGFYLLRKQIEPKKTNFNPSVTIQLPIYNERYVAARLIDQIAQMSYAPLEIQVLDDSTDDTKDIISRKVEEYQSKGVDIVHIHRQDRQGYKAGALADAIPSAKGEFVAIFDADFLPRTDFLTRLMPYFENKEIGVVQTRWEHLNEDASLLTKVQAHLLNIHFIIEQVGRSTGQFFLQFNGTGGIWRKQTIEEAGGWRADTLTEDLDLSYRAQLKGWKIRYVSNVGAPAELPSEIHGLKSQQYRWMKGGAETAKLLLGELWGSHQRLWVKIQGTAHLLTSSVFVAIVIATILSVPASYARYEFPKEVPIVLVSMIALAGLSINYFIANWNHAKWSGRSWLRFLKLLAFFPVFMALSLGLSLHNAQAVLQGFFGKPSEFVRTPKFGHASMSSLRKKAYFHREVNGITLLEGLLVLYYAFGAFHSWQTHQYGFLFFHIVLALGYGGIFYFSVRNV